MVWEWASTNKVQAKVNKNSFINPIEATVLVKQRKKYLKKTFPFRANLTKKSS